MSETYIRERTIIIFASSMKNVDCFFVKKLANI